MSLAAAIESVAPGSVRRDVDLAALSRWRIGGRADIVVEPRDAEEVASVIWLLDTMGERCVIVGDSSNLLFDDAGLRAPLLRIGRKLADFRIDGDIVTAGGGIWVPGFVRRTINAGLGGCVHATGIPGTLGGLVAMNGGSQRKGIGDRLLSVDVADACGSVRTLTRADCAFAYRRSAMQTMNAAVVAARFRLVPADPADLRREALDILAERRRKFPKALPNCGSVFLSDPAMYARIGPPGQAIEALGLKGLRCGGAEISPLHANFIVNRGGARSADVLALIATMRRAVLVATGYAMDCEVRHVASDGHIRPAHESLPERVSEAA